MYILFLINEAAFEKNQIHWIWDLCKEGFILYQYESKLNLPVNFQYKLKY